MSWYSSSRPAGAGRPFAQAMFEPRIAPYLPDRPCQSDEAGEVLVVVISKEDTGLVRFALRPMS